MPGEGGGYSLQPTLGGDEGLSGFDKDNKLEINILKYITCLGQHHELNYPVKPQGKTNKMNLALFKHLMVIAIENISFIDPPFVHLEHKANFFKQLNQLNCAGYTHSQ